MNDRQRAFANKINKQGAAEVRRQVSSAYLSRQDFPKSLSGQSLSSANVIPLSEVIDPPDFEDIIAHQLNLNGEQIGTDPLSHLLEFPANDVEVNLVPRKCRSIAPVIPEHGADVDSHVRDCLRIYTSDYLVINRRYQSYASVGSRRDITAVAASLPKQDYEVDEEDQQNEHHQPPNTSGRQSIHIETPRGSWASSIFDLKNSKADPMLPNIIEHVPLEQMDRHNEAERLRNRQTAIFNVYPTQQQEQLENRSAGKVPAEHFGHRLLVKCLQLKLELEVEPIFATMAIYDAKERKKISESFYFDLTSEPMKKMLSGHVPYQDISTLSRSCVLSITYPSSDVFLVVKLEKVLQQGDITECAEPYLKGQEEKNKEKLRQNAAFFCEKLGKYRMPFAWTAIYLTNIVSGTSSLERESTPLDTTGLGFSNTIGDRKSGSSQFDSFRKRSLIQADELSRQGSLERRRSTLSDKRSSWSPEEPALNLENFRPVTLTVSSFFKQETDKLTDDDLYKFLADLKRPSSVLKRLKCIPGTLKLDISPCPDEAKYCLSPELYKINPYPDEKCRPTKEIVEFPSHEVYVPYSTYMNLLYVYPKSLNFTNRQGSARNIAVKVQFMHGEDEMSKLMVIFGKSSCPEFQTEAYAAVTYHNRTPDFCEEIKIKLPARLGDKHHLRFTFYHISCQRKTKHEDMAPTETPIGYTWLPLKLEGHLAVGEHTLPVLAERPTSNYSVLHPDVPVPGLKWVDGHKGLFNVSLHAVSSIHTQDDCLDNFLQLCRNAEDNQIPRRMTEGQFELELKDSVTHLVNAKTEPLVRFLPLVMDKLILLMIRPPVIGGQVVNIGQTSFEAMANIVGNLQQLLTDHNDQHSRNGLLVQYIQYLVTLPQPDAGQIPSTNSYATLGSTLGRPTSLPVQFPRQRRNSDPDLTLSNPASPDMEVAGILGPYHTGTRTIDRSGTASSLKYQQDVQRSPRTHSKKYVHEEVALQWVVSSGSTKQSALSNAWFFFELMIKSMGVHLSQTGRMECARKARFPPQYTEDIMMVVETIAKEVVERYNKDYRFIKRLNNSLAFFLQDLFTYMDRGFVFILIKIYLKHVNQRINQLIDATSLVLLKLDFLRIVCSHEHYVTLNLPTNGSVVPSAPASPTPSVASSTSQASYISTSTLMEKSNLGELTNEFRQQHFLAGIILADLATALESHHGNVQLRAINVVRNLLQSHNLDPRYADLDVRARIASLYLPIIGIVMDALPQLYEPVSDARLKDDSSTEDDTGSINQSVAMAIASSSVYRTEIPPTSETYESSTARGRRNILTNQGTRHLLICFLWVLKNTDRRLLRRWWEDMPASKLSQLLDALDFCVSNFEYRGKRAYQHDTQQIIKTSSDMKCKLEDAILGTGSARSEMMMRRRHNSQFYVDPNQTLASSQTQDSSKLRWRKDQTQWRQTSEQHQQEKTQVDIETDCLLEASLSAEVNTIVLDILEVIVQIVQNSDMSQGLLGIVMKVLLHMFIINQSAITLQHMFATQRALVSKFPELLFEEDTEMCADLCLRMLRHSSSSTSTTRSHASASLYLLMRQNFEIGNNFARVKMQVTMSLSSLVGQNQNFNEEYLRKSLKTILTYAESDSELQETTFPEQVKDLVFNLHMILSDTVKMKEFQEDTEMLLDLMYRIAKGYQNSPDLRLTWLQNMAGKHSEKSNHAEAAQCLVHSAALVAEYLNMLEDRPYLPVGCVTFQKISLNVLEESAVSDDVVSPDEEGICTGKYFTEAGLVGLLEQAASSFSMAGMFEAVNQVYKILIPIHEANREFKKLAIIHNKLQDCFNSIIRQDGKRLFGTYFRVGFYGSKYGDLDGEEFIYKEPVITKLSEISHRLEGFYSERFGADNIVMIKDSNVVERERVDPSKAYIQITYVEPYFDLYEFRERVTYFEQNYNIKRFMYATPFTMDGRAHGELHEQYKRKTILTTVNAFPYVKTRVVVIDREQIILSPIEVAIEDIHKKTKELNIAINQEPSDTKMLQMVLQGCIGTTVNQGPTEVAAVFFAGIQEGRVMPGKYHNKLRICFKDLLKKCADALHKNKALIGNDQKEYQRELERNYHTVRDKLNTWISNNSSHRRTKAHKRDRASADHRNSLSPNSH